MFGRISVKRANRGRFFGLKRVAMDLQGKREYLERIRTVLDYIDSHLSQELSVETLAGVACFSVFHFHRLFTAIMGESLYAYIRRLRLEWAANVLRSHQEMSVTEAGLNCGFSSSASFARAFKQHFGRSATEWRRMQSKKGKEKSKKGQTESKAGQDSSGKGLYSGSGTRRVHPNLDGGEKRMELKVEIQELKPLTMAYVRHHGGYDEKGIHRAYEGLYKWANARGLFRPETRVLGVSLDNPEVTPASKCRYDAGITVPPETEAKGEVGVREVPGGRHAVFRYQGLKEGIAAFYDAIYGRWLPESGFQPADRHGYEIHHKAAEASTGDGKCLEEHDHYFDFCLPVEPV